MPLDRHAHRDGHLAQPQLFGFARVGHLVPALAEEFGPTCRHLPLVCLPKSAGPVAVLLVGAAPGRGGLIDETGAWAGRWLPACLRRYPFILGGGAGPEPLVCMDAESGLIHRAAAPAPLSGTESNGAAEDGWENRAGAVPPDEAAEI